MATQRPPRLRRRVILGVPALAVAAVTVVARPTAANAAVASPPECVADLIRGS